MPSPRLPTARSLCRESIRFLQKQPVLNAAVFCFLTLPLTGMDFLLRMRDRADPLSGLSLSRFLSQLDPRGVLMLLSALFFVLLTSWGYACILLVGKRMIESRAGRARSSFRAVRRDALPYVLPLLLTSVLRSCVTLEWALLFFIPLLSALLLGICSDLLHTLSAAAMSLTSAWQLFSNPVLLLHALLACPVVLLFLPLLLPAFVYNVKTTFFQVIIFTDALRYREALHRSHVLVSGRLWWTLKSLLILTLLLFVPSALLDALFHVLLGTVRPDLLLIADFLGNALNSTALVLFLLSTITLYAHLKRMPVRVKG